MVDISFFRFNVPSAPTDLELSECKKAKTAYEEATDVSDLTGWSIKDNSKQLELLKLVVKTHLQYGHYPYLSLTLQNFSNQTHFFTQPSTIDDFAKNRYFEVLYYQFAACIQLSWFEREIKNDNADLDVVIEEGPAIGLTKAPPSSLNEDQIFKKAIQYFGKVKKIAGLTSSLDGVSVDSRAIPELQYYYLICWIRLIQIFKRGQYKEYYEEFVELVELDPTFGDLAIELLLQENCSKLKKYLVVLFAMSLALSLPFKDLSFLNSRESDRTRNLIIDLFTLSEDNSIEGECSPLTWYQYLVALSETNFRGAREIISTPEFTKSLHAEFQYVPGRSTEFLPYFRQTIDLKSFLMIISYTKRITSLKLLEILGHPEETANDFIRLLVSLVSMLNLGETGVGYDAEGRFFSI